MSALRPPSAVNRPWPRQKGRTFNESTASLFFSRCGYHSMQRISPTHRSSPSAQATPPVRDLPGGVMQSEAFPAQLEKLLRVRRLSVMVKNAGVPGITTAMMLSSG